jgi:DNA-binding CsgD family transcriptional regulator
VSTAEGGRRLVRIDLQDSTVRFAVCFAVEQAGWSRTRGAEPGVATVADQLPERPGLPPLDVLVVGPTPAASRAGLDAFGRDAARAVVASTDPAAVPRALEAARQGLCTVSQSVVATAQGCPPLTPRLERTLLMVLRGRQNQQIAREMRISEATVKRDLAELLKRFDARNRVVLVATALRLGLPAYGRASPGASPAMLQTCPTPPAKPPSSTWSRPGS